MHNTEITQYTLLPTFLPVVYARQIDDIGQIYAKYDQIPL